MRYLRAASWAIEPLVALVFVTLWVVAESGRRDAGLVGFIGLGAAIALSRRAPRIAFGVIGATLLLQLFGIGTFHATDWPANFGIVLVVGFATARGRVARVWIPLVVGEAAIAIAVAMMVFQQDGFVQWVGSARTSAPAFLLLLALGTVLVGMTWGMGWGIRVVSRLDAAEVREQNAQARLAESEVRLAIAEERDRIAQEMHDVLAHSLAVIVAQADGARYLRSKRPAAVDAALVAIAAAARGALSDVGGMIDSVLDGSTTPQPGLAGIPELAASVRAAGVEVTVTEAGHPGALAPAQEVTVFRIVQEGLTNALRHRGRGSRVAVVLDWRGPGLSLQVVSSGSGDAVPRGAGRPGRGIPGMIERARLSGGWLSAGVDDTGDHRVTAFLPYREAPAVVAA